MNFLYVECECCGRDASLHKYQGRDTCTPETRDYARARALLDNATWTVERVADYRAMRRECES